MRYSLDAPMLGMTGLPASASAQVPKTDAKPTIILVHGAFAESASWSAVVSHATEVAALIEEAAPNR